MSATTVVDVVEVVELGWNLRVARQKGTTAEQRQGERVGCVGRILYRCGRSRGS